MNGNKRELSTLSVPDTPASEWDLCPPIPVARALSSS